MVDFAKRAAKAGGGLFHPGEEVLGATNVSPAPFGMANAGMVGGMIAGGAVGAAVGAAYDKFREKKEEDDAPQLPEIAARPQYEPQVPANGALLAATTHRLILWKISGLGKPKDVLADIPIGEIDSVVWFDADTKWMRGKPKSTLMWFGLRDGRVLTTAAITMGPAGKYVADLIAKLGAARPGLVEEFAQ